MLPDRITLTAGFVTDESFYEELSFFRQTPYGIDFSPIADVPLYQSNLEFFAPSEVSKTTVDLGGMDLYTIRATPDLLTGSAIPHKAHTVFGLCCWFDARLTEGIHIATGPNDPPTHWNQIFFPFKEPFELSPSREVSVRIWPPTIGDYSWSWTVSDSRQTIQMNDFYPFKTLKQFGRLD